MLLKTLLFCAVFYPLKTSRKKPTEKQRKIEAFIASHQRKTGCSPTLEEIRAFLGCRSTNTVRSHLTLLAKKGRLTLGKRKARSIRLTSAGRRHSASPRYSPPAVQEPVGVPLLGTIPAGPLEEALETMEETLPVQAGLFPGEMVFALRVKGDSMKDAGILPGDYAIMNSQAIVPDGEIAAVCENGEATLKRVFTRQDGLLLRPANAALQERLITRDEVTEVRIAGRMVGLVRVMKGGRL